MINGCLQIWNFFSHVQLEILQVCCAHSCSIELNTRKNSIFTRTLDYSLEILMKCQNNIHLVSKTEYPHSTNYHSIFLFTHDDTFCHGNRLIQMVVFFLIISRWVLLSLLFCKQSFGLDQLTVRRKKFIVISQKNPIYMTSTFHVSL